MNKQDIFAFLDRNQDIFTQVNDSLWDYAETAFDEHKSMDCICKVLEEFGFSVEKGVADIPTAFVGAYGSGYPVIGILGEFDALSGMSQVAGIAEEKPLVEGGNGHGCAHHTFGAGSLGGAVAVKQYLESTGRSGTIKFFGCPGEEGGSGKAFMARGGVFDGLDIALAWHPGNYNGIMEQSMIANYQVVYKFKGQAAHAGGAYMGRSALDALELMNVGVQFLREHVIPEVRIHYAITDTGGFSPNVVQARAKATYLIRAPKFSQVEEVYQRINKIARGMAMATETEVEIEFIKSCANLVPNRALASVLYGNLKQAPMPTYTPEELDYAHKLYDTVARPQDLFLWTKESDAEPLRQRLAGKAMFDEVMPFHPEDEAPLVSGSTDVGDVSWIVPTAQFSTACAPMNTPSHSWQRVSCGRTSIAHKGLVYAAKILAGSAIDLMEDDSLVQAAKAEYARRLKGEKYVCPIPPEVKPRAVKDL